MSSLPELRAVAAEPHFAALYATRLSSQFADGVFQVALASFVLFSPEQATTAARTAAAFATLLLPYSLVGPFAGVFIDRWRRQRILVASNLLRAVTVCAVAVLVGLGIADWRFYAAALAVLSVNRFFLAALSAALPHVVPAGRLVVANSLSTTSGTVAAVLGGGAGLVVRAAAPAGDGGTAIVLLAGALVYAGSAGVATRLGPDLLGPDHDPARPETVEALRRVVRGMVEGARHVRDHRLAGKSLLAIAAHRFFYGLSTIATLLLYRNHFHDRGLFRAGLPGLGQVFFASALGVLAAAVVTPVATRRIGTVRWIVACYATAAVVEVGFGAPYTQPLLLAAAFVLGGVAQGSKICVDTIVQESVEDDYRGRVFSLYDILFNVSFVGAAAVAAATLPPSGKSYPVLALVAVGYAATAAAYAAAARHSDHRDDPARDRPERPTCGRGSRRG